MGAAQDDLAGAPESVEHRREYYPQATPVHIGDTLCACPRPPPSCRQQHDDESDEMELELDQLFVTSARIGLNDDLLTRQRAGRAAVRLLKGGTASMANFMFCTGIENSIPSIDNGRTRIDQMELSGHYERWRDDFDCVEGLGVRFLRFGPPLMMNPLPSIDYGYSLLLQDENQRETYPHSSNDVMGFMVNSQGRQLQNSRSII